MKKNLILLLGAALLIFCACSSENKESETKATKESIEKFSSEYNANKLVKALGSESDAKFVTMPSDADGVIVVTTSALFRPSGEDNYSTYGFDKIDEGISTIAFSAKKHLNNEQGSALGALLQASRVKGTGEKLNRFWDSVETNDSGYENGVTSKEPSGATVKYLSIKQVSQKDGIINADVVAHYKLQSGEVNEKELSSEWHVESGNTPISKDDKESAIKADFMNVDPRD